MRCACRGMRRCTLPGRGFSPDALAATQSEPEQKSSPVLERTTTRRVSSVEAASSVSTIRRTAGDVERSLAIGPVDDDAQHALV